jgi:HPt (histidine-containing phosphotransfer) domain-containing protein
LNTSDPTNSGATALVDFGQLQAACDGDAAVMRELVDLYFQQADDIMGRLEKAINGKVLADVNHLAHKLAGSSLACGMSAVTPSLRQLELGAKAGHLDGAGELFAHVTSQMALIRLKVQEYLLQYPSQQNK